MQQQDLLVIENLEKSFTMHVSRREIHACRGISLHLAKGEFIGITGKSGSGKSTILKGIYRTNLPQKGRILYDSEKFGMLDLCQASDLSTQTGNRLCFPVSAHYAANDCTADY